MVRNQKNCAPKIKIAIKRWRGWESRGNENPSGKAKIETYTVANGRNGPQMGIVIGRLDADNKRFIAISNDEKTLETMMSEECLNRDCVVARNSDGYSIFSIK